MPPRCRAEVWVNMFLLVCPMSTHDAREELLSRRFKKALIELQEEATLDVLEGCSKNKGRAKNRDEMVNVVELRHEQNGQKRFRYDKWTVH